jgi:predicted RNA binding protein YcfA (HicA-like mRNA interferase family)
VAGRLPVIDGRRVVRALTAAGFLVDRIVGSHHVMKHPGERFRVTRVGI